jgi:hypothetical protein
MDNTIYIVRQVNSLLIRFKASGEWNTILQRMNEQDVDYTYWTDLDIIIWYMENYPEDLKEIDLNLNLNMR